MSIKMGQNETYYHFGLKCFQDLLFHILKYFSCELGWKHRQENQNSPQSEGTDFLTYFKKIIFPLLY